MLRTPASIRDRFAGGMPEQPPPEWEVKMGRVMSNFKDNPATEEEAADVKSQTLKVVACVGIAAAIVGAAVFVDTDFTYAPKNSEKYRQHMENLGFQVKK